MAAAAARGTAGEVGRVDGKTMAMIVGGAGVAVAEAGEVFELGSKAEFKETLRRHPWVVVKFTMNRCTHCETIRPTMHQLAYAHPHVRFVSVNVDVGDLSRVGDRFDIEGFPTCMFFHLGRPLDRLTYAGANSPAIQKRTADLALLPPPAPSKRNK
jgi:thioredoxin-like negative regulator of GroEL